MPTPKKKKTPKKDSPKPVKIISEPAIPLHFKYLSQGLYQVSISPTQSDPSVRPYPLRIYMNVQDMEKDHFQVGNFVMINQVIVNNLESDWYSLAYTFCNLGSHSTLQHHGS